ncbi:MAG: InlB B-repeat-containing protein [Clostridiales bacterium]|jgi:hypothetical protein|nr:InlB B-repeat-containing protein [Clostridiales bacterium]
MRKVSVKILVVSALAIAVAFACLACHGVDRPVTEWIDISYTAMEGGVIAGAASQRIKENEDGTEVTAVPDTGYRFVKWSDDVATAARTDTGVTAAIEVTAQFAKITNTVTYVAGTGGTVSGDANQTVPYGEDAETVTAVPNTGYRFVKWSDDVMTAARTDTGVTAAIEVTAQFAKITYTVTYVAGTGGTVSGDANQTVPYGEDAEAVTAVPNTGYRFVKWSDDVATAARTDTGVTAAVSVTAIFERDGVTFFVAYSAGAGGTFYGTANQTVLYGQYSSTVTVIPLPNAGYIFEGWSDGVQERSRQDLITDDLTATANFRRIYTQGKGLPTDPYLICYYQGLLDMVYFPAKHYKLTCDLNLDGKNHTPIFDGGLMFFDGSFDGNGYTIRNMTVDAYHPYPSLFGCIGGGSVKNLNIEDFEIIVPNFDTSEYALFVGAVCGDARGTLANISVSGRITAARIDYNSVAIGGLVGRTMNTVTNCHADIVIELNNVASGGAVFVVGGLVGQSVGMAGYTKIDLTGCDAAGYIDISYTGNKVGRVVGGLAGSMDYYKEVPPVIGSGSESIGVTPLAVEISASTSGLNIIDCYAEVDITCDYETNCGGLIGYVLSELPVCITDSHATGNIAAEAGQAGGFLATFYSDGGSISNCYATGNIEAWQAGGFAYQITGTATVGVILDIIGSYTMGDVKAYNAAGFIFSSGSQIDFIRCYTTGNIEGDTVAGFVHSMVYNNIYGSYTVGNVSGRIAAGFVFSFAYGAIESCFSIGNVEAVHVAGLVATLGKDAIMRNCYSTSNLYSTNQDNPNGMIMGGGLVATMSDSESSVENCYFIGTITGVFSDIRVGGIVGAARGHIANCYYLVREGGKVLRAIGTALSGTVLTDIYEYENLFDFYELADTLNRDNEYEVWVNIPNGAPELRVSF